MLGSFLYALRFPPCRWAFCIAESRDKTILGCGKMSFTYKEQYAVVVMCKDEKEQEQIYNRMKEEGLKVKVVAV